MGIPILLLLIIRSIGFDGLYGQDAYEYLRYTRALSSFMQEGISPRDYFWPIYYPLLGAILTYITSNTTLILQLISILSMGVATIYVYNIILLIYTKKRDAFIYAFIFFLCSPMVFKMGLLVMSDMLAMVFIVLCFYHSLNYIRDHFLKSLYLGFIFGVCAIMTRYASFVLLLPLALYIFYILITRRRHLFHCIFLVVLLSILISPHLYIKGHNSFSFIEHNALSKWSVLNFFKNSFITDQGYTAYRFPNIIYAFSNLFHPRYFIIGSILLPIFLLKKVYVKSQFILIVSIIFYSFFIAGIDTQNPRFLLLSFPLILIVIFPAFVFLLEKISSKKIKYISASLLIILQLVISIKGMNPILERNTLEKQVAKQIESYQKNTLYSFDIDIAMQGRDLDFNYKNLWIEAYQEFEEQALVLFHPTKFNKQWEDKNPMLNWHKIQKKYQLKILEECYGGWKLYQIHSK